jgi:DNA-binding MarR family transcriptional regulator
MNDKHFQELTSLFFSTRQIIRQKLPSDGYADPNGWLRFETLRFIERQSGPTMREVAGYVRIKAPSVTSLVDHLVRLGFVTKQKEPSDRRLVRLYPTKRGEDALKKYGERCARTMREVFSKLPEHDTTELVRILRHLGEVHGE